jgi:hypothetical protein
MAGSKRPSFLKRQKEQTRLARAEEKRTARRMKKHAKSNQDAAANEPVDDLGTMDDAGTMDDVEPMVEGDEPPREGP